MPLYVIHQFLCKPCVLCKRGKRCGAVPLDRGPPAPPLAGPPVRPTDSCDDSRNVPVRHRNRSLCLASTALAADPASPEVNTARRLAELKKSPPELYAFLYKMPKGADLHNHLSGAIYAENFLEAAAQQHLCVDKGAMALVVLQLQPACLAKWTPCRVIPDG